MQIWSTIVQSNTFNFLVMVIIFIVIFKKCKVMALLDNTIENIEKTISKAKRSKEISFKKLGMANMEVQKIPKDIEKIELQGKKNIELSEQKLKEDIQKELESIEINTKRTIDNKNFDVVSNLSTNAVNISIELAKKHAIKVLEKNPSMHQSFIDKSIDEIDEKLSELK